MFASFESTYFRRAFFGSDLALENGEDRKLPWLPTGRLSPADEGINHEGVDQLTEALIN